MISVARSDWDHIRIMIRSDQKSVLVRTCFPPRTNQSPISLPHHGYPNRVRIYSQEITVPTEYRSLLLFPYDSCCPSGLEMDSSDCSWQSQAIAVAQFSTTTLLANRRGEEIRCSDWHMDEELCRRDIKMPLGLGPRNVITFRFFSSWCVARFQICSVHCDCCWSSFHFAPPRDCINDALQQARWFPSCDFRRFFEIQTSSISNLKR